MRKNVLKCVGKSTLIVFAFVFGSLYSNNTTHEQFKPPTDIELHIIESCIDGNYFTVRDYHFYCFPAKDP